MSFKDPRATMLESATPVVAVCAVRTGAGKSQTSRRIVQVLREAGLRVVVVRHPMPYGDLSVQRVQHFATVADLKAQRCTIEEMEEYEPHLENGTVVGAGGGVTSACTSRRPSVRTASVRVLSATPCRHARRLIVPGRATDTRSRPARPATRNTSKR
jgi:hypothetical protein